MTQIAANAKAPLDAAAIAERQGNARGRDKGEADGEFARLVKDAGTGTRKPAPDAAHEKAGRIVQKTGQPEGHGPDVKTVDPATALPRERAGEGEHVAADTDRTADGLSGAGGSETGNGQPIHVPRPAGSSAAARESEAAIKLQGSEQAPEAQAARPAETNGNGQTDKDAETVQSPAAGPAPVVAVMAVAPYLTARTISADIAARPAAPQPSAIEIDRVASAETIDMPAGKGQAASSRAETIDMAFAAGKGGREGDTGFGNARTGAGQAPAVKLGAASGEGPAIPAAGSAAAPAGGEARPPQPVVVPLDLGRALAGEGDLPASMREAVSSHVARVMAVPAAAGQPVSVLRIQLQPAHLGQINVTMRMSGEQMTVTLTPDSASAARALGSDQETIATVLRAVGGSFAGANIEIAGEGQMRTGGDDTASRSFEGRQGDRSGEGGRGSASGGAGGSSDGIETGPAGAHNGAHPSSAEGRIII